MVSAVLRPAAAGKFLGLGKSALYERRAEGLIPAPVLLGPRAVGYPQAELEAVMAARVAGLPPEKIKALVVDLVAARPFVDAEQRRAAALARYLQSGTDARRRSCASA